MFTRWQRWWWSRGSANSTSTAFCFATRRQCQIAIRQEQMANPYGQINQTIYQPIKNHLTKPITIQSLTLLIKLFSIVSLCASVTIISIQWKSVLILQMMQRNEISIAGCCSSFQLDLFIRWRERESKRERERERKRKYLVMKPTSNYYTETWIY